MYCADNFTSNSVIGSNSSMIISSAISAWFDNMLCGCYNAGIEPNNGIFCTYRCLCYFLFLIITS